MPYAWPRYYRNVITGHSVIIQSMANHPYSMTDREPDHFEDTIVIAISSLSPQADGEA
jgi:hypothetical protein